MARSQHAFRSPMDGAAARFRPDGGLLDRHHVALPRLDQTEFEDAAQLKQRIERFLSAPDKRLDILRKQRAAIEHRLSFSSGLARSISRIAELVESGR